MRNDEIEGWVTEGIAEDDPRCLHTIEDAVRYIKERGFLPLFSNEIPDFSLEERTVSSAWWGPDPALDPWEWREVIAQSREIVYGRFFGKKTGFITKEWFPYFVNLRRDGYDFDALWDDEKASARQKKIMDLFSDGNEERTLYSYEMKQLAGFGKGGEKNFDGTLAELEMRTYLCVYDFGRKKNKKGEEYGWKVSRYARPEAVWGYEYVTSQYKEEPEVSGDRIRKHMLESYPALTDKQCKKVFGFPLDILRRKY